ncbi:T/G mismatch-specific endonuclease [Arcticibacter pallidicorallinus]|uniref:Very short patch repair endonuclease n=1 Tax=Arcticibacter pallidicorallinus TaxID=1259464 RepID=A0A2T0UCE5_9SPHI|nr:DNA mismatch endonuclease Vsr [Arcticibacter pallidicorallinus]PRY55487.1 T/G mismatch-specific endonuclease [Arcticibacter pallidicorallinus]
MADVHTEAIRSYNMSRIRSKNTKPEVLVRKQLHRRGFRFRINVKNMLGKPDIVLPKYKTVIFVNGCFWHGHKGCRYFVIPKTRTEWWLNKISRNSLNDEKVIQILANQGWFSIVLWECELKNEHLESTIERCVTALGSYTKPVIQNP